MAKDTDQHTPVEWNLGDLLSYLRRKFRWRDDFALYAVDQRIAAGDLPLKVSHFLDEKFQGESVVDPSYYRNYLGLEIKGGGVQVITKHFALVPGEFRYTVLKQDAEFVDWLPCPPASQTALDQEPKDKASPDPFKTGAAGHPTAAHLIRTEAERRIAEKEVTPTSGGLTAFSEDLEKWWDVERVTFERHGPPMKAGSIKNVVRELWNAALGAQN
jgi:hypothetical protein